jgi:hypothetical protein
MMPNFEQLQTIASVILGLAALYGLIGVAFGGVLALFMPGRLQPAAHGAPLGFRLIILPAAVLIWPLLLKRLLTPAEGGR